MRDPPALLAPLLRVCLRRPTFAQALEELQALREGIPEVTPPLQPMCKGKKSLGQCRARAPPTRTPTLPCVLDKDDNSVSSGGTGDGHGGPRGLGDGGGGSGGCSGSRGQDGAHGDRGGSGGGGGGVDGDEGGETGYPERCPSQDIMSLGLPPLSS